MKQKTNITSLVPKKSTQGIDDSSVVSSLSPREIVSELEKNLTYPGQIKVMVIRELRSIEIAN